VDDLSAELRKIIEAMKVGEVSQPLRTARGYQILKLESSTPTVVTPFEQAREQIANNVINDKRQREFLKYLERLRGEAIIEWKNPEIKKAYDEGLKQQVTAGVAPSI
jgi:parvulin-like peptidyl-prolyl isomerase